jgi:hypothetical protein
LNLQNSFEDWECIHYSLLNFNSLFLIGKYISRIFTKLFEKRHIAACRFSKEFCANPRNISTNRMRGIALSCLQKSFVNSKAFGVKWLKTY